MHINKSNNIDEGREEGGGVENKNKKKQSSELYSVTKVIKLFFQG
jgi:hypothetical protein